MSQPEALRHLLNAVAGGEMSPDSALDQLKYLNFETVDDFARIDHHRALRTGFPEVIWGPGKTPEQIARIMEVMRDRAPVVMATRIEPDVYAQLKEKVSDVEYYELARICALRKNREDEGMRRWGDGESEETGGAKKPQSTIYNLQSTISSPAHPLTGSPLHSGSINILSAGTADLAVAEEAAVTAELCGFHVQRLWDVGVAGIHRLLSHRETIAAADVLIVVAGMEGALPSVVAGLADCPVIAVPTSIGYGASFNGLAALLAMLNSCAAGVGVVNIDNGFGAAILAGQILRTASRMSERIKDKG
ncbi:MAG: nickel pincer cofactor biosynthesis protein LarB [Leptolyngbyaceae cyanobacterium RU_5_1]|nr:nickel pincer cofactor biosynthesis protein LarB [Leptolyngbyaceae cyanobacterium RU_5_1]